MNESPNVEDRPVADRMRPLSPGGGIPAGDAPPSDPTAATQPGAKQTQRPHPLTPLLRGWIGLIAVIVYFGRDWMPGVFTGETPIDSSIFAGGVVVYLVIGGVLLVIVASILVSWWFTRFVIDDEELRIETGAIFRQSKRIPFTKVQAVDIAQPLVARIVGLAELSIDAGADAPTRLRYLRRSDAYRFRDFLLARAHGTRRSIAEASSEGGVISDVGGDDEVLVKVGPGAILIAALLNGGVIFAVVIAAVAVVPLFVFGEWWIAPAPLIGLVIGAFAYIQRVAVKQFNYVLTLSGRALKVTRGLTSLTSQSIPRHRVQAVRIRQSFLWRPFGLYRVDIETLQGVDLDEGDNGLAATILIPAGTAQQVDTALAALWPVANPGSVPLRPAAPNARWLRPVTAAKLRHGADAVIAVVQHGRFSQTRTIMPHRRIQSVRIQQGPLQRRLGLATVALHTAGGSLTMAAEHLDPEQARAFADLEATRSRTAPSDGTGMTGGSMDEREDAVEPAPLAEQLGWPRPVPAPDPGLGYPHLAWP